jgi:hypothetical protein
MPSGIQTHGPGVRASEDISCFRPLGYRDRPYRYITPVKLNKQYEI